VRNHAAGSDGLKGAVDGPRIQPVRYEVGRSAPARSSRRRSTCGDAVPSAG
jgi:hypothetical protein